MKSVLFVCLGNICRSPMAQTVFEKIIEEKGMVDKFEVDSAGLHGWHEGDKADPRMKKHAEARGYDITHRSRPIRKEDFDKFDYIVGMDEQNIKGLYQLAKIEEHKAKILRMADFLQKISADFVPDPYYGGAEGFEYVIDLLEDACEGFYQEIKSNNI
ncbi:MAG TPA: low molecular weight phosphotyrosine protein phosphatase [Bacteroidales bacterium]|nr:low molecular weight phosphotyrosine protein phosphatase [Bacteroidales bacterium]